MISIGGFAHEERGTVVSRRWGTDKEAVEVLEYVLILPCIDQMLGDDLRRNKQMEMSKSSFLGEDHDERKLRELLEERDRTIRKLSKKIDRLQATLRKTGVVKNTSEEVQRSSEEHNYFQMLKIEVEKTRQLEEVVRGMSGRISQLLEEVLHDNSFADNSEDLRVLLDQLELQNNLSVSLDFSPDGPHSSLSISQEWTKLLDLLEGTFRSYKQRTQACQKEAVTLAGQLTEAAKRIAVLEGEQVRQLRAEVRQQRKQREKLKGLLEKTEIEKNDLINRINSIGLRDPEVKAKTREELVQYSKQLNYRIRDLQMQKQDILKIANRQQQSQLKKYQDVLRQLRSIKEVSRMGKSCA